MLTNNWLALFITFVVALAWLRINDFAAHRGYISSRLSRKIIHTGTGPLFVMCWILFNPSPESRYLAALVPALFTLQFLLIGLGIVKDQASVDAMSRTGNPREILKGPLFYGIIFVLLTIIFWYDTPVGIIALMVLCGGDGLADIIGRRFGSKKLPWNQNKSILGSLGMFLGSWVFALAMIGYFILFGVFSTPLVTYLLPITVISVVCTLVETIPFYELDNLTITVAAVFTGLLLF